MNFIYSEGIKKGVKKDDMRQILPIGIAGDICVAGRLQDWEHIFKLRCDKKSHWEIQVLMKELEKEFTNLNLI